MMLIQFVLVTASRSTKILGEKPATYDVVHFYLTQKNLLFLLLFLFLLLLLLLLLLRKSHR